MNREEALAEKIFEHFKERENRSYPLLLTKAKILQELRALEENRQAGSFSEETGGETEGFCGYIFDEEERYLQTVLFVSFRREPGFVRRALGHLKENFPDYELLVGIEAENSLLKEALQQQSFVLGDDSYALSLEPSASGSPLPPGLKRLDEAGWRALEGLHEAHFGDCYWNHKRISSCFDEWFIAAAEEQGRTAAYAFTKLSRDGSAAEIFGVWGRDPAWRLRLISGTAGAIKEQKLLFYFTEDEAEAKACEALGFEIKGHYQAWERT